MECTVKLIWDKDSDRWHSETDSNLRLTLEAASFDVLVERIRVAAPEMLELNCGYKGPIHIRYKVERIETLNCP
jgi:hypothetical protein